MSKKKGKNKKSKAELLDQLQATEAVLFEQGRVVMYAQSHLDTAMALLDTVNAISARQKDSVVAIATQILQDGVREMLHQRFPQLAQQGDGYTPDEDEIPF